MERMKETRLAGFQVLELVHETNDTAEQNAVRRSKTVMQESAPARRLQQLRQARLRRVRFLEKNNKGLEQQQQEVLKPMVSQSNKNRAVKKKPVLKTLPQASRSSNNNIVKKGDVSEMRNYLNAFEEEEEQQQQRRENDEQAFRQVANDDDDDDVAVRLGLDPNSLLYQHAVAEGKLRSVQQAYEEGGIFGLTAMDDFARKEPVKMKEDDQSSTTELALIVQRAADFDASITTMYSKQGKSYSKMRGVEKSNSKKGPETEEMPPSMQTLGRTPHLQQTPRLIGLEMDVLKCISIREDALLNLKQVYRNLLNVVAEERQAQRTIIDGKIVREANPLEPETCKPPMLHPNLSSQSLLKRHPEDDDETELSPEEQEAIELQRKMFREEQRRRLAKALQVRAKLHKLQQELGEHMIEVRNTGLNVARSIETWRTHVRKMEEKLSMAPSLPIFDYQGQNYLVKMTRDVLFLDGDHLPANSNHDAEDEELEEQSRFKLNLKQLTNITVGTTGFDQIRLSDAKLISRWIGFKVACNPLFIAPPNLDVLQSLIDLTAKFDRQQRFQAHKEFTKEIGQALQEGKNVKDFFGDELEQRQEDSTQRPLTHRAQSYQHHHSHSIKSQIGGGVPMTARDYDDREHGHTKHNNQQQHHHHHQHKNPKGSNNNNTGIGGSGKKHHRHNVEEAQIEETEEYKARQFDLSIMPRNLPIVSMPSGKDEQAELELGSKLITGETKRIDEFKNQFELEEKRQREAYDPLKNVQARGGTETVLSTTLEKSNAGIRAILRRRQEEGNPSLSENDPVRGQGGQPLTNPIDLHDAPFRPDRLTKNLQTAIERSKLERVRVDKQKAKVVSNGKGGLFFSNLVQRMDGAQFHQNRIHAHQHEKQELLKRVQVLRKRKHRLGGTLSKEERDELAECEMRYELLRMGPYLPEDEEEMQRRQEEIAFMIAEQNEAATIIQSLFRMQKDKLKFAQKKQEALDNRRAAEEAALYKSVEETAAIHIQAYFRGFLGRKIAQLREASTLLALVQKQELEEKRRQERFKHMQVVELQERGRKRREEMERKKQATIKQNAIEASKKAEAARQLSRQAIANAVHIASSTTSKDGKDVSGNLTSASSSNAIGANMKQTTEERAAVRIQSLARGFIIRSLFAELAEGEKERIRKEYSRKRDRDRYAKLYSVGGNPRHRAKAATMVKEVRKLTNAIGLFLPKLDGAKAASPKDGKGDDSDDPTLQTKINLPDIFRK